MYFRVTFLTAVLAGQTLSQDACYNFGASKPRPSGYAKCPNSDMCCRTEADDGDSCATSADIKGLCISRDQEIYRQSCTDPRWESEGCLKLCWDPYVSTTDNTTIDRSTMDYKITRCPRDGSLCCGAPGTPEAGECCNQGRGVYLDDLKILTTRPTSGSLSATSAATASVTPTSSPSSSPAASTTPSSGTNSNTGAIVGGVVGGIGAVAILAVATWLLRRHKKRNQKYTEEAHETVVISEKYQTRSELPYDNYRYHGELHGHSVGPAEMAVPSRK